MIGGVDVSNPAHIPTEAKNIANNPSSTITRKIDLTTETVVVHAERSRAALHLEAFARAPQFLWMSAMNGALIMPT